MASAGVMDAAFQVQPEAEIASTQKIQAVEGTESYLDKYSSTTLEGWQIALVVVVAVCCLGAAAAVTVWCVKHRRKDDSKRQEFNRRMSKYYDSISIDENFSKLNYELFSSESEGGSTISTQLSTPVSPRSQNPLTSIYAQTFKISNGKLPSLHFQTDYKFSLEDTMKKLQEFDTDDNITQIRNTYRYFGGVDDSMDEDMSFEDTNQYSPRFRYFHNDQALIMDTLPFTECTHL